MTAAAVSAHRPEKFALLGASGTAVPGASGTAVPGASGTTGPGQPRRPVPASPARRRPEQRVPADRDPVAQVAVDVALPHLDRSFDYLVPSTLDGQAVPGARVRVRFAGKLVDGFVLDRVAASGHAGSLSFVERSVSAEPALTPEIARLARAVADRYAGSLADVLRLAVPPRHARAEAALPSRGAKPPDRPDRPDRSAVGTATTPTPSAGPREPWPGADSGWEAYDGGAGFQAALAAGRRPRAVWTSLPGPGWAGRIADAIGATLDSGRGAVAVVPDARDLARLDAALLARLGPGRHVALASDLGPAERYRRWLQVRRGVVRAAVGTRAAMFAPVVDLGLVVVWDDGDDLHAEPRAPYPHVREVLVLRAHLAGAAALLGGYARTAEGEQLLTSRWASPLLAPRAAVRAAAPLVRAVGDESERARDPAARTARLPTLAWRTARDALAAGHPVLVQVPRRGYIPALACARCRAPARCGTCSGPLGVVTGATGPSGPAAAPGAAPGLPICRWCGRLAAPWSCGHCGAAALRAVVVGAWRTAEELGRAFPGVPVLTSGRDGVLAEVEDRAALVVATPGAEPLAAGGYGAALLLDGWALLGRPDLRAAEEALRRWLAAAALVRSAAGGGRVVVAAEAALPTVQALVRWDPAWHAARELAERAELGFPPAVRMASVTGTGAAVADLLAAADLPPSAQVLGPIEVSPGPGAGVKVVSEGGAPERALVRVPRRNGPALAAALHAALGVRSARKAPEPVRVQIDPLELA